MKFLAKKIKKELLYLKRNRYLLFLILPGFLWFIFFEYIPLIGNVIAFKDFRIFSGGFIHSLIKSEWVGFKNFIFLFSSSDSLTILRNTIGYNFIFIILNTVIPATIAIALNELWSNRARKTYQSLLFFPYFLSWVVVSYFLLAFLDPEKGMLTLWLEKHRDNFINFYLTPVYWPFILILINTWKGLGYGTVLYLANIVSINKSYYESAMLDGASKFQQIRYITIPHLKSVAIILIILAIAKILNSDFGLFFQVPRNSGALFNVTQTLDTFVYRAMTGLGDIGMSSAAALFQSSIGFVLVIMSNFILRKIDRNNALF